jgi:hypothetical protein
MSTIDRVFWFDTPEKDITGPERDRLIIVYLQAAAIADEETDLDVEAMDQVTLCDPISRQVFVVSLK